ncbi:oxidoreductase [Nonomuraea bangladeshensis]
MIVPGFSARPPRDWNPAERRLWRAFQEGQELDLRTGVPDEDDPATGPAWTAARRIRAQVIAALLLNGPASASGRVRSLRLTGARVTGRLDLRGAVIDCGLDLVGCFLDSELDLTLASAESVYLNGCRLPELSAEVLRARTFMMRDAHVEGDVRIQGSRIDLDIDLDRTRVGGLLNANLVIVGGDFNGRNWHRHEERPGAGLVVGGSLNFAGAQVNGIDLFAAQAGEGVWLQRATVGYLCAASSQVNGRISLQGSTVTGELDLAGALVRAGSPDEVMIDLSDAQVGKAVLTPAPHSVGVVSLRNATFGTLQDLSQDAPRTELDGAVYERLQPLPPHSARRRLAWLRRGSDNYTPQPYEQLASAYRACGLNREAGQVMREKLRRAAAGQGLVQRVWGRVQDLVLGYGYQPWRAAVGVTVLLTLGTLYFSTAQCHAAPAGTKGLCPIKSDEHPAWDPFLYTLDLLIPLVSLGHDTAWDPVGMAKAVALALTVAGWVLATTIAAAAARTINRS